VKAPEKRPARRRRVKKPVPPAQGAAYASIEGIAGLLGVGRTRVRELRADPTFPSGRTFGGGGTLRFEVAGVLEWAARQPHARFSSIGGRR
jgi:predicted DNA-binding transcriptional regulator AlpA